VYLGRAYTRERSAGISRGKRPAKRADNPSERPYRFRAVPVAYLRTGSRHFPNGFVMVLKRPYVASVLREFRLTVLHVKITKSKGHASIERRIVFFAIIYKINRLRLYYRHVRHRRTFSGMMERSPLKYATDLFPSILSGAPTDLSRRATPIHNKYARGLVSPPSHTRYRFT